jgi:diaminopimelate epimerase
VNRTVDFVKMSGAGNDFIVLGPGQAERIGADPTVWIRRVCRRRLSVGADGVLVVEPGVGDRVKVTFRNPDGSPAFCGNGSRCAARFAHISGMAGTSMTLETAAGDLAAEIVGDRVRLRLPAPIDHGVKTFDLGGQRVTGRFVSAGVPHFVVVDRNFAADALQRWGPPIRQDPVFGSEGTNLDLVWRTDDGSLRVRTWERGVEGETLSCGSGAVAAAFVVRLENGPRTARVLPASGIPLTVRLPGTADHPDAAILEGDARVIIEGRLGIDAISDRLGD